MFDQVNGMPVHVLAVHAAVVFVPLLALAALGYALVPRWRSRVGWVAVGLAVVAPGAALVAMLSGTALYDRLKGQGLGGPVVRTLEQHAGAGVLTFWSTLALGLVTLAGVAVTRRGGVGPSAVRVVLSVLMVGLAVVAGYQVVRTGDSGARAVWGS